MSLCPQPQEGTSLYQPQTRVLGAHPWWPGTLDLCSGLLGAGLKSDTGQWQSLPIISHVPGTRRPVGHEWAGRGTREDSTQQGARRD